AAARYKYAYELLHAGESAAAVREFETLRKFIAEGKVNLTPDKLALVRLNTMVSYLRLGEQDNCLLNHTTASCIMPIQPGGFDNDGNLDLMISAMGLRDQLRFFHNNGDGTFTERTEEAGLMGEWGGLNMVQADYNNDGFIDVLVLRGAWFEKQGHHPKSLLRNNGDGTFTDVTEEAGLLSFHPTQT